MSYWDHLELKISIKDAEIDIGENIDQSNLEVIVKLTSGAVETVSVANSTNEIYFDITNQYDVLRFSLVERDTVVCKKTLWKKPRKKDLSVKNFIFLVDKLNIIDFQYL